MRRIIALDYYFAMVKSVVNRTFYRAYMLKVSEVSPLLRLVARLLAVTLVWAGAARSETLYECGGTELSTRPCPEDATTPAEETKQSMPSAVENQEEGRLTVFPSTSAKPADRGRAMLGDPRGRRDANTKDDERQLKLIQRQAQDISGDIAGFRQRLGEEKSRGEIVKLQGSLDAICARREVVQKDALKAVCTDTRQSLTTSLQELPPVTPEAMR